MITKRSSERFPSARISWLAVALASSACGVDVPLGELDPDPSSLVGDEPSGVVPVYEDAIAPERIGAPELTLSFVSGTSPPTNNVSVGDMDRDGFDDMAVAVIDDATGTVFVHLRYGGQRPSDALGAFAFDQSGARLVLDEGNSRLVSVAGVHPAGDVDGDGYADLFVQTYSCENRGLEGSGGYLLYGGPERWEGVRDLRAIASHLAPVAEPPPASDRCGWYSFAAFGDIDGDGFDDMAMTNPEGFSMDPGVYVIYGSPRRFAAESSWSEAELYLAIDRPLAQLTLFPGGDLDGDGRSELLVKYVDAEPSGDVRDGRLVVVTGTEARLTGQLNLLGLESQLVLSEAIRASSPRAVGDLDGDGKGDLIVQTPGGESNYLFYGGPELLTGPIELSEAAAVLAGMRLVPVGDRDGDGDDELMALRPVVTQPSTWPVGDYGVVPATVSGTRTRLSGTVTVVPSPTLVDAMIYLDHSPRYVLDVMAAGDLDNDGATDIFTLSHLGYEDATVFPPSYSKELVPQLHLHYGVHVPPASAEVPH